MKFTIGDVIQFKGTKDKYRILNFNRIRNTYTIVNVETFKIYEDLMQSTVDRDASLITKMKSFISRKPKNKPEVADGR
jgi:DNA/RNA endonuclease YhcR with UshA esterase domain